MKYILISFFLTFSLISSAQEQPSSVTELRIELDRINFVIKEKEQKSERLETLIPHTEKLSNDNPKDAAYALMAAFYNIQYASYDGGIGALKYAKAAKAFLEKSIEIDPTIYGASAHAVLGRIYTSVPGWPIAFGNKKKGIKNMKKALELSPDTVDSNITYASYLFDEKKYEEAKIYFKKAKTAPARPNRELADQQLHKNIDKVLIEIDKRLN